MKYKVEYSKMPLQQNKQRHKQRLAKYVQKSRCPMQEICPLPSEIWPLENIVYFIAISSEIVKLLLKARSYNSICQYLI